MVCPTQDVGTQLKLEGVEMDWALNIADCAKLSMALRLDDEGALVYETSKNKFTRIVGNDGEYVYS